MAVDIQRARTDAAYRESLSPQDQALVAQSNELSDEDLAKVSGGTTQTTSKIEVTGFQFGISK